MAYRTVYRCLLLFALSISVCNASEELPTDEEECNHAEYGLALPKDEKSMAISSFIRSQKPQVQIVLCLGFSQEFPITSTFTITKDTPKKFVGDRLIYFNKEFYRQATIRTLIGLTAHELSHYVADEKISCETLRKQNQKREYAHCELTIDRRAADLVGLCTMRDTLREMHSYAEAKQLLGTSGYLEERILWFEKNTICTDESEH